MANWWYESMFTVRLLLLSPEHYNFAVLLLQLHIYKTCFCVVGLEKSRDTLQPSLTKLTYCQLPMRSSPPQDIKHTDSWANGRLIFIIIITTLAKPAIGCTCYCWILICCTTTSHIFIAITTYSIVIILHVLPHVQHLYYLPVVVHLMCSYLKLRCQLPSYCNMIVFPAAFALQPTAKDQFRLLFPLGKII